MTSSLALLLLKISLKIYDFFSLNKLHKKPDSSEYEKVLLQKYASYKVRRIYENVMKTIEKNYPQYLDELRGIAAGSKVPFFKVSKYEIYVYLTLIAKFKEKSFKN